MANTLGMGQALPADAIADYILVDKARHELTLLREGRVLKTYQVSLGSGGPGPKRIEGDRKVPEGLYRIAGRNPKSGFHWALRLSYPEQRNIDQARALGKPPGGDVMIHGLRNGTGWLGRLHLLFDWTYGCIAVTDPEMDELWRAVPDGTPIEILP